MNPCYRLHKFGNMKYIKWNGWCATYDNTCILHNFFVVTFLAHTLFLVSLEYVCIQGDLSNSISKVDQYNPKMYLIISNYNLSKIYKKITVHVLLDRNNFRYIEILWQLYFKILNQYVNFWLVRWVEDKFSFSISGKKVIEVKWQWPHYCVSECVKMCVVRSI